MPGITAQITRRIQAIKHRAAPGVTAGSVQPAVPAGSRGNKWPAVGGRPGSKLSAHSFAPTTGTQRKLSRAELATLCGAPIFDEAPRCVARAPWRTFSPLTLARLSVSVPMVRRDTGSMADWIFQSNPKRYDVHAAVAASRQDWWNTPRYRDRIALNDRVWLQVVGPDQPGIYYIATITSLPYEDG